MKIISQPDSYSDMLERIFTLTLITGVVCSFILATSSPILKAFLDSNKTKADIGIFKDIGALYVFIPLIIALISRMFLIHDKISDILRIRLYFDTHHILFPMADKLGLILDRDMKKKIAVVRDDAMHKTFYEYAGTPDKTVIEKHLVRTALDSWGWFWVIVESAFLIAITAFMTWRFNNNTLAVKCLYFFLLLMLLLIPLWFICRRNAQHEITAILEDAGRKKAILIYYKTLFKR